MDAAPLALKRESGRFVLSRKLFLSHSDQTAAVLFSSANKSHCPLFLWYRDICDFRKGHALKYPHPPVFTTKSWIEIHNWWIDRSALFAFPNWWVFAKVGVSVKATMKYFTWQELLHLIEFNGDGSKYVNDAQSYIGLMNQISLTSV